jgi:hypothetical protein
MLNDPHPPHSRHSSNGRMALHYLRDPARPHFRLVQSFQDCAAGPPLHLPWHLDLADGTCAYSRTRFYRQLSPKRLERAQGFVLLLRFESQNTPIMCAKYANAYILSIIDYIAIL